MSATSNLPQSVGVPIPRADGREKVTGAAQYTSDVKIPGAIWGKILHSPLPYAKIISIDTSKARALAGVHAVLTGDDVKGARYGRRVIDVPILAQGIVRFVGDQIAAVAAEDEDIAQAALDLIEIEYEELEPNFDPIEGMDNKVLIHPELLTYTGFMQPPEFPSNTFDTHVWGKGDLNLGFEQADVIIENTFTVPSVHQGYMEPHCCVVWLDDEGRAQIWAPNKAPHITKQLVAAAIGLDPEKVLFHPVTIGGDFGGKGSPLNIPLCYFLSKASNRPVRMIYEYLEEFMAANPKHPAVMNLKTGVDRTGKILAHEATVIFNSGAYAGFKPLGFLHGADSAGGGPYRIANTLVTAHQVYTNCVPCGHHRGPGEAQALFALESQIDCVARAIGMDPADFRRKNLIRDGEENALGHKYQDLRGIETLEAAIEASGYHSPKPPTIGRGIAMGDRQPIGGQSHAAVELASDGSITIITPIFEQGSGSYTLLVQIIAEELGLSTDRFKIRVVNTDAQFDSGVGGSRVTRIASQVAFATAQNARAALIKVTEEQTGWKHSSIEMNGDLMVNTDTGDTIRWVTLIEQIGQPVTAEAAVTDTEAPTVTSFTVQIAEVAVDPETGEVDLLKITTAHDTGRVINPQGHQGQVNGGVMHGIGYALMEDLRVEDGRVTALSFADYKIPTIADIPELKTVILESESGMGPYNVKGIGESGNGPTAAAIANAVADASGARVCNLPVTAERVYRALNPA